MPPKYNTAEGGALIVKAAERKKREDYLSSVISNLLRFSIQLLMFVRHW